MKMQYNITQWEFSNKVVEDVLVPDGLRTIKIESASYDPETYVYRLDCVDLETSAEFSLRYWLQSVDPLTKQIKDNNSSIGTMNSLGRAVFGDAMNVGVPAPCDVTGAVCVANIKLKESETSGKKYPRCYSFMSASEADSWASDIEQYFRPTPSA